LKIIVPVKYVPDIGRVKFDSERGRIDRTSAPGEINPFDLNALEEAVQTRDQIGGTIITITMGPPQAKSGLRDALSRGADEAFLLVDRVFSGADTLATSYTLASAIRKLGEFDLIICGEKTVDGDTGQVGPMIAEHLGIPHVAYVSKVEEIGEKKIKVVCDMEGDRYLIESDFPMLITVTKDINTPRLPTFSNKLKARNAKVEIWTVAELSSIADQARFGSKGSPTAVRKIVVPREDARMRKIFRGATDEMVGQIIDALEDEQILEAMR